MDDPHAGRRPPAKRDIGGTPSAALRALSIVGVVPWHSVGALALTPGPSPARGRGEQTSGEGQACGLIGDSAKRAQRVPCPTP
ncbi:hypothetical protein CO2235_30064 [Cupriavidus oxalaticus]|uniref:Uncharacterized protein n=1 Tax=Cupriavidus oxalaticus TaxID=96344 RepID=A0A976GAM4_9BURK|nr:hypothetical protein CO2235_30064 [Cupriavidus oxalaticus]